MISGILMYDITISARDTDDLAKIQAAIVAALKGVKGVEDSEEVDSDVVDDTEET